MPYLADFEIYDATATATSHSLPVPAHAANDILVAWLNADGVNAPGLPTSTGGGTWVSRQTTANIGGQSFRLATLVCTSANETCTSGLAAVETMAGFVGLIKGNGGTLAYDTSTQRGTDDSTEPFDGVAITPGSATALLLQFLCSDGGIGPMIGPPYRNIAACDTGANSVGAAMEYPRTTSAVPLRAWYSGAALDNTMAAAITFTDDGSEDIVPAYLSPTSVATYGYNGGNATKNGWTWDTTTPHPLAGFGSRAFEQVWSENGAGVYTDETTDASDPGTADVTITNTVGAALYVGMDLPFDHVTIGVSTAQAGGTLIWEYWNGAAWVTLSASGSTLTAIATVTAFWTASTTSWAQNAVNGVTKYWARLRHSLAVATMPVFSTVLCGGGTVVWITTAAAADSHQLPYANSMSVAMTQSTTLGLVGASAAISPAVDWDTGVLILHHRAALSRDYAVDICKGEQDYPPTRYRRRGGMVFVLVDSSGNYEGYVIHSKQSESNSANDFNTCCIAINNGALPFLQVGTLNRAAIAQVYILAQPEFGALTCYVNNIMLVSNLILCGGGVGGLNPIGYEEFIQCVNNSLMYSNVMARSGDLCRVFVPLQIGGDDHCNISMSGKTFVWPEQYDGQTQHAYNGNDDILNWIMYGQSSDDQFSFPGCVFTAGQPQTWGFHASHSASAVLDFAGATVNGFNVVMRSTVTLSEMIFRNCPTFDLNSAVLDGFTFFNTHIQADAPADVSDITNSSFESDGTGHAIEISGSAADFTLDNVTFTGYAGTNGSTGNEAIYVNIASGTVTINVTNGGDTPSIRTAGATVNVVNARTVRVTARDADTTSVIESARVALWATTGASVTITRVSTTATVAHNAHGYSNGQKVVIFGANQGEYNGLKTISNVTTNSYDYTVSGSPTTPATGTITSHRVILDGDTSVSGVVEDTAFPYTSDLAVTGRVRKGTSAPRYKTSPVSGTITSAAGFDATAYLVSDA